MKLKDLEIVPKNIFVDIGKFVELRKTVKKLIDEWGFKLSYVNEDHNYFSLIYSKENFNSIYYKKEITFNISNISHKISYRIRTNIWSYSRNETLKRTETELIPLDFGDFPEYTIIAKDRLETFINNVGVIFK